MASRSAAAAVFLTHSFSPVVIAQDSYAFRKGFLHRLEADFKARCVWYYGAWGKRRLLRSLFQEGGFSTVLIRVGEAAWLHWWTRPLAKLTFWFLRVFCHVTVGCGASFGPGLVLLHPFGVFLHKTVKAGANLVLQNSITLGGEDDLGPTVGDNVFIGVGARAIGPVTIGHRCRIGANAVVVASVKDDHVAAGNPARQIPIARGQ